MGNVLSASEFEEVLRKVKEALDRLEPMHGQMNSSVKHNAIYWALPPNVKDKLEEWLRQLWDWIKKIAEEVGKFFALPGDPGLLYNHGQTWTNDVGGKASHWKDAIHVGQLKTDDEWKGAAATAYKDILPLHQGALGAIKAATDEVQDILIRLAAGICAMWVAVGAALTALVLELAACIVGAATGAGAPPALAAALGACAKAFGIIAGAAAALEAFIGYTVFPAIGDLQQRIRDSDGFPNGHWPSLTKDIATSSMHGKDKDPDTDDIDWEMTKA